MGRKSAKSKEKKLKRKEDSAKLAAKMAVVHAANAQEDPMSSMLPFKTFDRNGIHASISCGKVTHLDQETVDWAFNLTKANMETLYEESHWGWNDKQKREEMTDEKAWFLIARVANDESHPVALVHFRFDLEGEDEVLYCYEIQLEKAVRRKGLGKFLMQILELLAFKAQMKKVMLTVFRNNHESQEFFKKKLKYEVDESSPEESLASAVLDEESSTHEILSKKIGIKPKPVAPQVTAHNGFYACGGHCCH